MATLFIDAFKTNVTLNGTAENDTLDALTGGGNNTLNGGDGDDELYAYTDDKLYGEGGNDQLFSEGNGSNILDGGDGNDIIRPYSNDSVFGGAGDDVIYSGLGGNTITGGIGKDTFWLANAEYLDTPNIITDFKSTEDILLVNVDSFKEISQLTFTTQGNDTLVSAGDKQLAILQGVRLPTATSGTITINEDSSKTFTVTDFGFNNIDGNSLQSIKITQLATAGTLQLNGNNVTLNQIITATNIPNLVFTPGANANGTGYANFKFIVNDGTADSIIANTITVNVTAVNDIPTATNSTITINEDSSKTFTVTDFGFNDIDGNSLQSIKITQLATAGTLQLNGNNVTLNQIITATNIPNLVFTPAANANGTGYANFKFTVNDGTADSTTANTITVNVTAVNDIPTATNSTITINKDSSKTFTVTDFGFNDIDGNSLQSIKITQLATAGTLQLNGNNVTLNQIITAANIPSLVFTPAANANGTGYANFKFTVNDGTADSTTANTITVNVTAVNDIPSAINVDENVIANTVIGTFSSTDPDTGNTFTYSLVAGDGSTDN
ncbi:hypothetical protein IQ231_21795, partial [Cuspidothrix issatschenkoi LEGE 03284]|uniref:Ig-like domain-containing protein n=1 Tax=Cuspidothrix issatschenkoi TaxID=230752 RepID=UPI0019F6EB08